MSSTAKLPLISREFLIAQNQRRLFWEAFAGFEHRICIVCVCVLLGEIPLPSFLKREFIPSLPFSRTVEPLPFSRTVDLWPFVATKSILKRSAMRSHELRKTIAASLPDVPVPDLLPIRLHGVEVR